MPILTTDQKKTLRARLKHADCKGLDDRAAADAINATGWAIEAFGDAEFDIPPPPDHPDPHYKGVWVKGQVTPEMVAEARA